MVDEMKSTIEAALPGAQVEVTAGGGGHYSLRVVSNAFESKSLLQKQRLVLSAIAHFMKGNDAPVHAIDKLETLCPDEV